MKNYFLILFVLLICKTAQTQTAVRTEINLNKEWKFFSGNDSLARGVDYDDRAWRIVNIPHDWSIEGTFSDKYSSTTQQGALPTGIGWYRKSFVWPVSLNDKRVRIEFDGVYRNSEVWINGQYLGKRPNGYISFSYDLTRYIRPYPAKNHIAVKVDNSQQPSSRWYTGSGIYRAVRLIATNSTSITENGVFVRTPVVSSAEAAIDISTDISNLQPGQQAILVRHRIYDHSGKLVADRSAVCNGGTDSSLQNEQKIKIKRPIRWSVSQPLLYQLVTEIYSGGKQLDELKTSFGIRSFYFDKDKGFFLNDQPLKIKGVCMHHDLGALGAAFNVRAAQRQLQLLKEMGCNAIRTAHNPVDPAFLSLCDRMGFLVMEEAFDMWAKKKNKYDYYADFNEWHERDLRDMVLRDRNHPSVFMWSIGNEIREQFDSTGIRIAKELVGIVKKYDHTRPVTSGLSEWDPKKNFIYQSHALDLVGLNYHHEVYKDFKKYYPGEIFLGTENMSAFATRGYYSFPSDSSYFWPAKSPQKLVENGNPDFTISAFDQVSAYWGSTHEQTWKIIKEHDFLSGLFVWSGFDFLGEPIPYPWPARSSYYGIIDLAGFPKDIYYMYQSEWTAKKILHVFPHWNWKPGQVVDIWAYYNHADEAELFINGRSAGKRNKENDLHVMWRVPFEAGSIKVVSRKNGKTVLVKEIRTAGDPVKIELMADRSIIRSGGNDLSYITARVLDKKGIPVPDADQLISFSITGAGDIAATDNGYQADTVSFKSHERKLWKGLALAILRSTEKKGNITLQAKSPGLKSATITLKSTD